MPLVEQLGGLLIGSPPVRRVGRTMTGGTWRRGTIGAQLPRAPRAMPAPNPVVRSASAPELRARRAAQLRLLRFAAAGAVRGGRRSARRVPFYGR